MAVVRNLAEVYSEIIGKKSSKLEESEIADAKTPSSRATHRSTHTDTDTYPSLGRWRKGKPRNDGTNRNVRWILLQLVNGKDGRVLDHQ